MVDSNLLSLVKSFEPTGLGNPAPTFVTKKVVLKEIRKIGKDGSHLKMKIGDRNMFDAIGFGMAKSIKIPEGSKIDVVYTLDENIWNGKRNLQLKVKDLRLSENTP